MTRDQASHTAYSDPGRFAALLEPVPTDPDGLGQVARNVIAHYRGQADQLPESSRTDIHARWVERIVDLDQSRHPVPLADPRPEGERVQGCCRDHSLFSVSVLRSHGIAARTRIGFVDYFIPGWNVDHVIVEYADPEQGGRWRRFDPELWPADWPFDRLDLAPGEGFLTAAQVWRGVRSGALDADRFGVHPDLPELAGEEFVGSYVLYELAHRMGDELLLWDTWGEIDWDGELNEQLVDEIAELLMAADAGDAGAEQELAQRYRSDPRLHPGDEVLRDDPWGGPRVRESLAKPSSEADR